MSAKQPPQKKQKAANGAAQRPAAAAKPAAAAAAAASGKPRKAAPRRHGGMDDDDSDGSSSGSDSDEQIGLTVTKSVKATIKPIAADAPPVAPAGTAPPQSKKRKAKNADADDEADDSDDGSDMAAEGPDSELIDVEFGIYDPKPLDYLTFKMMLKDYVHPSSGSMQAKKAKKKKAAAAAAAAAAATEEDADGDATEDGDAAAERVEHSAGTAASADPDFALHELCAALSSQGGVGSTIKGEGTDEPLGLLSALSLAWQEQHAVSEQDPAVKVQWPAQMRRYVLRHTPPAHRAVVTAALNDPSTGLLVSARLLNAPPQMVPHLHQCLLDDLSWAQVHAIPPVAAHLTGAAAKAAANPPPNVLKAYRDSFKFKQLLLIGRTFRPPPGAAGVGKGKQRTEVLQPAVQQFVSPFASKKKQKQAAAAAAAATPASAAASSSTPLPEFEWLRFEEELYAAAATVRFSVAAPFTAEDASAGRLPQRSEFMLLPMSAVAGIVQQLHAMAAE